MTDDKRSQHKTGRGVAGWEFVHIAILDDENTTPLRRAIAFFVS